MKLTVQNPKFQILLKEFRNKTYVSQFSKNKRK